LAFLRVLFGRHEIKPRRILMSAAPTRKVTGAGAGGALGIIVAWALGAVWGFDVSAEAGAAISTVLGFAGGYIVREA
jgi:hypothetical protein